MTTPDNTKWMVGICAKVFSKDQISRSQVVKLLDPSTQQARQYIVVNLHNRISSSKFSNEKEFKTKQSIVVEVQSFSSEFSSFFVGRHIVKDGNLYVLNPVDPLFFVLASLVSTEEAKKCSWQPLDQTLSTLPEPVREAMNESQLGHLCQTLCTDQTDNVTYFKFSVSKALAWLSRKQEKVRECLIKQERRKQERSANYWKHKEAQTSSLGRSCDSRHGGSVSASFNMPDDPMAAMPNQQEKSMPGGLSSKLDRKLEIESLQIVCNYLSEEWTDKFLESKRITKDEVFMSSSKKPHGITTKTEDHSNKAAAMLSPASSAFGKTKLRPEATEVTPNPPRKAKIPAPRSVANKRLDKVNKRGMSALTSFFGPAKKKGKK